MKNKYYKIKDYDNIHIIIGQKGYGKTYREVNDFIKDKLLKDKKVFIKQQNNINLLSDHATSDYLMYDSLISYIDDLLKYLKENNNE